MNLNLYLKLQCKILSVMIIEIVEQLHQVKFEQKLLTNLFI